MKRWELFIDESGTFDEMQPDGGSSDGRRFPSLIGGVLAPAGAFSVARAEVMLRKSFASIDGALPELVYRKCDTAARKAVEAAFDGRDYSWTVRALTERLDELEAEGATGQALVELASVDAQSLAAGMRERLTSRVVALVDRLAAMPAGPRHG